MKELKRSALFERRNGFSNYARGTRCDVLRQAGTREPRDRECIVGRLQLAPHYAAGEVYDYIVECDATVFGGPDTLENLDNLERLDLQARFFAHFTAYSISKIFARFNDTSGNRPPAAPGLISALHQKDTASLQNYSAHAENGPFRVAPQVANTGPFLSH